MKFKKKTTMLLSFTLGTLLVATTAVADIANKSGYERFKDSIKSAATYLTEEANSYTIELSVEVKDNGQLLDSQNVTAKYDRIAGATERLTMDENINQVKHSSYSYDDKKTYIRFNDVDPTYYVTEYTKERNDLNMSNPFKEDEAEDLEKIADALVGNLKDYVIAAENPDGSLELEGSLSKVQIPSLINAVASYAFKQDFNGNQDGFPHLKNDIYVKEVKGTAKVNGDGVMENIFGSFVLTGTDKQGTVHDISMEILVKLSDINATIVTKPDLTGKQVVTNTTDGDYFGAEISNPEKFVGTFKNDILIVKGDKFVKVGERLLVIDQLDNQTAAGRYYEEFKPEFAEYGNNQSEFTFIAQKREEGYSSDYELTTESGTEGNIYFDEYGGNIHFNLYKSFTNNFLNDSNYSPDLE